MKYIFFIAFLFSVFFFPKISFATHCTTCGVSEQNCTRAWNGNAYCGWNGTSCVDDPTMNLDTSATSKAQHDGWKQTPQCGDTVAPTTTSERTLEGNLINPLSGQAGGVVNTTELVGRVVRWVFGIIGALALLMFIIGGTYWIVSFGNENRITKGRQILIWTSVGLLLIFSSYAVINFVLSSLVG